MMYGAVQATAQVIQKSGAKKTASLKQNAGAKTEVDQSGSEALNFGNTSESVTDETAILDPDETSDGKERLTDVTARAKALYFEADQVRKERAPIASRRDKLAGEMNQLQSVIEINNGAIETRKEPIYILQTQIEVSNDRALIAQRNNLLLADQQSNRKIQINKAEIDRRKPTLDALNIEIAPLDERLAKLGEELNACRKQWLEIRVPQAKYARCEYESLKRVIDDWARIDGSWPEAFCWRAITAFELGEYDDAWELVEKAEKLSTEVHNSKKTWPQISALKGLVATKLPSKRKKADEWIGDALRGRDKRMDWETFLIVGRALSQKKSDQKRAEANFTKALAINPRCLSAQYHLAVLQTSAKSDSESLSKGIMALEQLWVKTGKRSWRISNDLALAYKNAGRSDDMKSQLVCTLDLAPIGQHAAINTMLTNE